MPTFTASWGVGLALTVLVCTVATITYVALEQLKGKKIDAPLAILLTLLALSTCGVVVFSTVRVRPPPPPPVERWMAWVYPELPCGKPTLGEFIRLTDGLVGWADRHAPQLEVSAPLTEFKELTLQRARCRGDNTLPWRPTEDELVEAAHKAVAAAGRIKQYVKQ